MATKKVTIGPPFAGIQDRLGENGVQVVSLAGFLPDNGQLIAAPAAQTLDATRGGSHGIFVWGTGNHAITVTINRDSTTNHMIYTASRDAFRVVADLTDLYSEDPVRDEPYSFATLASRLYFAGGQQVFSVDRGTLEPTLVELYEGPNSNNVPYLKYGSIPARRLCAYNGRMLYLLSESKTFQTHQTVDPNDPLLPDPTVLQLDGQVKYDVFHILVSDGYRPNCVPYYNALTISDEGCEVTGCVPWNGMLVILTTKGVWLLQGDADPSTWTLKQQSKFADCIAPGSVVSVGDVVMWVGTNAIWKMTSEGIAQVPNTDWIFRRGQCLVNKLYAWRTIPFDWSTVKIPQWNKVSASAFGSGRYYVFCMLGLFPIAIEIMSGRMCLCNRWSSATLTAIASFVHNCESSGLFSGNTGMLIGEADSIRTVLTNGDKFCEVTYSVRLCSDIGKRIALNGIYCRYSSLPEKPTAQVFTLDDGIRDTTISGGVSTKPDWTIHTEYLGIAGVAEEGSVWSTGGGTTPKWIGTPATGQTKPSYSHDWPTVVEHSINGIGSDLSVTVALDDNDKHIQLEQMVIEYEEEPAP